MRTFRLGFFNILLLTSILSCTFFSPTASLLISIPESPEHWYKTFEDISYVLAFPNPEGKIEENIIQSPFHKIEIRVLKQNNLPITATPLVRNDKIFLPPAGGVYPHDLNEEKQSTLNLSWNQGFVAIILIRLISQGFDVSGLNSRRLSEEITARAEGDPWKLDIDHITEKLSRGNFRVNYIKMIPSRTVEMIPGAGIWFLESPFFKPQHSGDQEILYLENLPQGFHRLFDVLTGSYFNLYLDEKSLMFSVLDNNIHQFIRNSNNLDQFLAFNQFLNPWMIQCLLF